MSDFPTDPAMILRQLIAAQAVCMARARVVGELATAHSMSATLREVEWRGPLALGQRAGRDRHEPFVPAADTRL